MTSPLYAEGPPPLPKPPRPATSTNQAQLDTLGVMFSSPTTRVSHPDSNPARTSIQTAQHMVPNDPHSSGHLSQPNPLRQASASFSAPSSASFSDPENRFNDSPFQNESSDYYSEEYLYGDDNDAGMSHGSLDRPLSSRRFSGEYGDGDEESSDTGGWTNKLIKPSITPLFSIGGSLLIVVACFFMLVILFRKVAPQSSRLLPKEAFECLGRYFLTQKHQVQVLKLGNRIVLVSVMPEGVTTLAEITDPDETVAFLGLCRRLDENSATEVFRKTVANISEDEFNRRPYSSPSQGRPVVTNRRPASPQRSSSLDLYSEPDESLASLLARGRVR